MKTRIYGIILLSLLSCEKENTNCWKCITKIDGIATAITSYCDLTTSEIRAIEAAGTYIVSVEKIPTGETYTTRDTLQVHLRCINPETGKYEKYYCDYDYWKENIAALTDSTRDCSIDWVVVSVGTHQVYRDVTIMAITNCRQN